MPLVPLVPSPNKSSGFITNESVGMVCMSLMIVLA